MLKKSKNQNIKKIIVLIDDTASAAEDLEFLLKNDKRVILIGENTNGTVRGADPKIIISEYGKITLKLSTLIYEKDPTFSEGIGYIPDIWVGGNNKKIDFMKNLWRITEDYELVTSDLDVKIERNKIKNK